LKSRRDFLRNTGLLSLGGATGIHNVFGKALNAKPKIDKREAVYGTLSGNQKMNYTPAGFFVHFDKEYQWSDAAVKRHLEYFEAIDMDFIKIQYEQVFPHIDFIKTPQDWAKMPFYQKEFYEKQLYVVRELVKKGKKLAPVIATLYSPFMCAGHSVTSQLVTEHLKMDPDRVIKGMEIITDSVLIFARECIKLGVDGFLASTQGGEEFRFQNPEIFSTYIKPFDLEVMKEINTACDCNVLHICDYEGDYNNLSPFLEYPGSIVNCSTILGKDTITPKELSSFFDRPFMGGLEKRGPITTGNIDSLDSAAKEVLDHAPPRFILGAECALLGEVDWKKVRRVVDRAHGYV
jgi:uroporphyrinogen decarboxylase